MVHVLSVNFVLLVVKRISLQPFAFLTEMTVEHIHSRSDFFSVIFSFYILTEKIILGFISILIWSVNFSKIEQTSFLGEPNPCRILFLKFSRRIHVYFTGLSHFVKVTSVESYNVFVFVQSQWLSSTLSCLIKLQTANLLNLWP